MLPAIACEKNIEKVVMNISPFDQVYTELILKTKGHFYKLMALHKNKKCESMVR